MKIYLNQIPPEGLTLAERISPGALDLDTQMCELAAPVAVKAELQRGTNCVSARLSLRVAAKAVCSRCLNEFEMDLGKEAFLNFPVDTASKAVDLTDDIREAILLDYPIKPLCKPGCLGLCALCGANLNEKKCSCKFF